jgi:glycosyltransferase involved in cell wall biosynthesis
MYEFSIIIPVYNEQKILEQNTNKLLIYLKNNFPISNYEIVICSNGSLDKTNEIGKKLSQKNKIIKFISIKEKGAGIAFRKAFEIAKYENIISLDMDLSTDLSFLNNALDLLISNHIVVGSKQVGNQKRSFFRLVLSNGYIFLVKILLGINYSDYSISSKAYKKSAIKNFLDSDKGTFYVIRVIYFAYKNGLSIVQIPVDCFDKRKSRFNLFNEIFYRFWKLIILFFKK